MTETFRLSATPSIGRRTASMSSPRPGVGQAVGLGAEDDRQRPGQVGLGVEPLGVDAGGDDPHAALAQPGEDLGASAPPRAARVKTVPALARIAFGLNRSVRGEAAMTASAPAPSALRSTAPRLPGFSTPSRTTTSGSAGRTSDSSAERGRADDRRRAPRPGRRRRAWRRRGLVRDVDRGRCPRAAGRARPARPGRPAAARRRTPRRPRRRHRAPGAARARHRPGSGPSARARAARAARARP